jgi:hypothetical protein
VCYVVICVCVLYCYRWLRPLPGPFSVLRRALCLRPLLLSVLPRDYLDDDICTLREPVDIPLLPVRPPGGAPSGAPTIPTSSASSPTTAESEATPATVESEATPASSESEATPATAESEATPVTAESEATPTTAESEATPATTESEETPTHPLSTGHSATRPSARKGAAPPLLLRRFYFPAPPAATDFCSRLPLLRCACSHVPSASSALIPCSCCVGPRSTHSIDGSNISSFY